jgi:ABC-type multidrug transport system fused ATPase/permease subunit
MNPSRSRWRLLLFYLRPQMRRVVILALLILGVTALQVISPQLVRRFLDAAETGTTLNELVSTAAFFVGIAIIIQLLKLMVAYLSEVVAWTATNNLRADLALHCLKLDMSFHKLHKPGELIERIDGDVNLLANFFSQLVIQLTSNLLLVAAVAILLWLVDWRVGLSITLVALAGLLWLNGFNKRIVPRWEAVRQVETTLFGYLEEWLTGTEEIVTNGAAPYVMRRLYQQSRQRWQQRRATERLNVAIMMPPLAVPILCYIAAYIWTTVLFRDSVLSIGTVFVIFFYINIIRDPLWEIRRQVQDLQRASASLNRISNLFGEQSTISEGSKLSLPPTPLSVRFDHVSFHYADDKKTAVLDDLSFELAAGERLGLLGRTGSGKSTLTRLLFRFYDPTHGAISLGGSDGRSIDLRQVSQSMVRSRIGLVTQEVQLFHATVRDNLTLFDDSVSGEQIMAALDELGLRRWLASLPDGLNTRLEGGESLSAGEAQLLALGRVLLADPGLIILDEASSRLDPATEGLLEQALDRLLAGRTAIIIAHRLATVARADKIMILADGRVIEYGDRETLTSDPESRFRELLATGLEIPGVPQGTAR